eukprot:TRINITY_DN8882_c2_g1_i1.p1 TRINITY_DN8882_c2_g1~~TRINITY_DN8882_c2_g1_i1.p1  ORF type:complete len:111 (+),score=21.45 TRINITY_DN8882_c2_g1_i1:202-534(+)
MSTGLHSVQVHNWIYGFHQSPEMAVFSEDFQMFVAPSCLHPLLVQAGYLISLIETEMGISTISQIQTASLLKMGENLPQGISTEAPAAFYPFQSFSGSHPFLVLAAQLLR